ncbi:MAG: hypothetical protein HZB43_11885 [candidate division Zixibacteria bacterium]|nr:hypothetical protein [candidate division Zixibacteria bacterium]
MSTATASRTLYLPDTTQGNLLQTEGYDTIDCPDSSKISPVLELRSGWVRISWPPLIRRGDINLDGDPFNALDFLLLRDFFLQGYSVWNPELASRQIPATDCNGDGEPLTVADLDYLFRIFGGSADLRDTLPGPYSDSLLIMPSEVGGRWVIGTRSTCPVSMLWLQIEDTTGGQIAVRYLGDTASVALPTQTGGTLRLIVMGRHFNQALRTVETDLLEITTPGAGPLRIAASQASKSPGVSMVVQVAQRINGVVTTKTICPRLQ